MILAMEKLNTSIEKTIITTVGAQRVRRNHPNESTLFSIKAFSASTIEAVQLPTPIATPIASAAPSLGSMQAGTTQPEANISTSVHHDSKSEDQHVGAVEEEETKNARRSLEYSLTGSNNLHPKEQVIASPRPSASAELIGSVSNFLNVRNESLKLSSASLETTLSGGITTRHSSSIIVSSNADDSISNPVTSSALSPGHRPASQESLMPTRPQPGVASPGDMSTLTGLLTCANQDIYFEIGKLHLTLTRDVSPLQDHETEAREDSDYLVQVKLLDVDEQHSITTEACCGGKSEIIDAQAIAPGDEITVAREAMFSEHDFIISWGPDILLSIRYKRPP